jgi:uncharacterized membrane protein YphA (DoxX/SURF4 family)
MIVFIRILIGLLLIVSGGEKLLNHYQNFLYVIQSYEIFPTTIENLAAYIVPWIELLTGIFLLLGLWLSWTLKSTLLLFAGFILIVSQAIIRQLPISECGCFGSLISLPLWGVLTFDSVVFLLTLLLIVKIDLASRFSLDRFYGGK